MGPKMLKTSVLSKTNLNVTIIEIEKITLLEFFCKIRYILKKSVNCGIDFGPVFFYKTISLSTAEHVTFQVANFWAIPRRAWFRGNPSKMGIKLLVGLHTTSLWNSFILANSHPVFQIAFVGRRKYNYKYNVDFGCISHLVLDKTLKSY